jgi:hypothetical protein
MSLESIIVVNTATGCDTSVEQQVEVTGYQCFIVRLPAESDAIGPFDVYTGSTGETAVYVGITRNEMIDGVTVCFGVAPSNTPTPTPTGTPTPTPSITPTITQSPGVSPSVSPSSSPTPTPTPSSSPGPVYSAYIFPEPQDSTSQADLGNYMFTNGAINFYGYANSGTYPAGPNYASDLNIYVQYPDWSGSSGNFITDVASLNGLIRQSSGSGTDSFGCTQSLYTFGSVEITTSSVNPNIQYVYSVWVPLAGVGGTLNNMTLDVGTGTPCTSDISNGGIPDVINASENVTVPSGCAIPAGTYRVLWMSELVNLPAIANLPLGASIFIKGESKS